MNRFQWSYCRSTKLFQWKISSNLNYCVIQQDQKNKIVIDEGPSQKRGQRSSLLIHWPLDMVPSIFQNLEFNKYHSWLMSISDFLISLHPIAVWEVALNQTTSKLHYRTRWLTIHKFDVSSFLCYIIHFHLWPHSKKWSVNDFIRLFLTYTSHIPDFLI